MEYRRGRYKNGTETRRTGGRRLSSRGDGKGVSLQAKGTLMNRVQNCSPAKVGIMAHADAPRSFANLSTSKQTIDAQMPSSYGD